MKKEINSTPTPNTEKTNNRSLDETSKGEVLDT